jgi:CheY-like chemotaxis protein
MDPDPPGTACGVLVIDDDEFVRAALGAALRAGGFVPYLAAGGAEAVQLYREHRRKVGVVLLDVRMPGMDGPATLAALRGEGLEAPCCFMTAYSGDYTEEHLLGLGAAWVFAKPFLLGVCPRNRVSLYLDHIG